MVEVRVVAAGMDDKTIRLFLYVPHVIILYRYTEREEKRRETSRNSYSHELLTQNVDGGSLCFVPCKHGLVREMVAPQQRRNND